MPAPTLDHLPTAGDPAHAVWAALVALVEDVHQPQDNLTDRQWQAADALIDAIPHPGRTVEERIVDAALLAMDGAIDAPDMPEAEWRIAEALLAYYTRIVEGR